MTFDAQVDITAGADAAAAAWAAVAVEIHDAAHPAGGSPIEWVVGAPSGGIAARRSSSASNSLASWWGWGQPP